MVRVHCQNVVKQLSLRLVVGGLEAAQELVERFKHLAGKLGGDDVLILPAVFENRRETERESRSQTVIDTRAGMTGKLVCTLG